MSVDVEDLEDEAIFTRWIWRFSKEFSFDQR